MDANIHKRSILYIGAGASVGVREQDQPRPPLGMELLTYLRNRGATLQDVIWRSQFTHGTGMVQSAIKILEQERAESNIERLLSRLPFKERSILHRLLQMLFCDLTLAKVPIDSGFTSRLDGYDEIIRLLRINPDHWTVISLNYDYLFEEALLREGIPFCYDLMKFGDKRDDVPGALRVYKPHGSINFFSQLDVQVGYGKLPNVGRPTRLHDRADGSWGINFPVAYACNLHPLDVLDGAVNSLCHPVMANFAPRKESDFNEDVLIQIRANAIKEAQRSAELAMIGVNPIRNTDDDPFCAKLLEVKFEEVTYVGYGDEAGHTILSIYPHAKLHREGVSTFISALAKTT